jgi:hypothetical protein
MNLWKKGRYCDVIERLLSRSMCILHRGSGKMQLFRGSKHQEMVFGHHVAVVLVNLAEAGGCSAHALQDGLPLTHRQLRVTLPETRKPMNSRTLLGLAAILGVFSISAHAQAAAEAALAHAASSASTVKAGSILDRALNQGSNQLAGRIQQVAPAQVQAHGSQGSRQLSAQANSGTVPTGAPGGSSLIVSVKGNEPACAASAQAAQEKTTAGTANLNCTGKAAPKTKSQTQYKSAVTLSFPK